MKELRYIEILTGDKDGTNKETEREEETGISQKKV